MEERITLRIPKKYLYPEGNAECWKEAEEEEPVELEEQFVLRLPTVQAEKLRCAMAGPREDSKDYLQIQIEPDMRHAVVKFDNCTLRAEIRDLPSIAECHKTLNHRAWYKVAEISQIMVCDYVEPDEDPKEVDEGVNNKKYLHPHGLTPSLKNVRKTRFRKTLQSKTSESSIEKEVKRLLNADLDADSSWFELVEDKRDVDKKDPDDGTQPHVWEEYDLFGEISSISSEEEEYNTTRSILGSSVDSESSVLGSSPEEGDEEGNSEPEKTVEDDSPKVHEVEGNCSTRWVVSVQEGSDIKLKFCLQSLDEEEIALRTISELGLEDSGS